MCGGYGSLKTRRQRNADAGVRKINGDGAEDESGCCYEFKKDDGLEGDAAYSAQAVVTRDAGNDAAKDERRNDHANEAEKDIAEEVGLRGELRRVHTQFRSGQHGEEGPHEQRTAAHGEGNKQADASPAKTCCDFSAGVKEPCKQSGREQHCGCRSESDKDSAPGLRRVGRGAEHRE